MKGTKLNPEQLQAVRHGSGPMLVVAGAGTGKTRVITERIAHLISTKAAQPHEILALTFTERAAREMAERLYDSLGWQSYQVGVMTLHAFGSELLIRYAHHIGRSVRGGLINDTQKALLLQQHLGRVKLSYYGPHTNPFEFIEAVVDYLGRLQNAGITAQQYDDFTTQLSKVNSKQHPLEIVEQQDLASLYSLYESLKKKTGTFDFNDQLQIPLQILQQKPNIAERLSKQYRYILVDEYQDTNTIQDELLRAIIPPDGNLFAVGDDDQAIYGFRGAEIGNILTFADHYRVDQPLALIQNYRSGQEILDAAYSLIVHNNPDRLEVKLDLTKRLLAQHLGSTVRFTPHRGVQEEAEAVQQALASALASGAEPSSLAVLSATHAPLQRIARGLRSKGLPFALSTRVSIFEQPELNHLWYLMQWIGMKADAESIGHIMLSRFIGWDTEMYRRLRSSGQKELLEIEDMLRLDKDESSRRVVTQLDTWRAWAAEVPVSVLAYRLVFETGVSDQLLGLAASQTARIQQVFEDMGKLFEHMQDYESFAQDKTLAGYLSAFPKQPTIEATEPLGDERGIQLLTVHAAKGLEFDQVFVINCTHRSWSPVRSAGREIPPELLKSPDLPPEHELRRLMYVAVTRARQHLHLSAAVQTRAGTSQLVSGLVAELLDRPIPILTSSEESVDEVATTATKLQRFYPLKQHQTAKLPFETAAGWLELSVSALASYDFCPYDFYIENVLSISQPVGPQLAFGTVMHRMIEAYYQAILQRQLLSLTELEAQFEELWSDRGYQTQIQAETAKQTAHQTLRRFYNKATQELEAREVQIVASELPFKLEIAEAKLRVSGKIDAVFSSREDIEIRDFKTGRKTDSERLVQDAKGSLQLRTYALAYETMTGQLPAAVTLDYLVTDVQGTAELSPRIMTNHRRKLGAMAAAIRAGRFAPKPSNLHQCAAIRYYGTAGEEESGNAE